MVLIFKIESEYVFFVSKEPTKNVQRKYKGLNFYPEFMHYRKM